jgi:hypothetical protein
VETLLLTAAEGAFTSARAVGVMPVRDRMTAGSPVRARATGCGGGARLTEYRYGNHFH